MAGEPDKPRLIIDEDWKSKVQSEKAALKQAQPNPVPAPVNPPTAASLQSQPLSTQPDADETEFPPASLSVLLSSLATDTLMCLGQVAHPATGEAFIDLDQARHTIDTLGMLEQKTLGNRTADESALLDSLLHELRMVFLEVERYVATAPPPLQRPSMKDG